MPYYHPSTPSELHTRWGDELPGRGLPSSEQINQELFDEQDKIWVRIRVVGTIALEPIRNGQGQPFANWAASRLGYIVTTGKGQPPAHNSLSSDVTYREIKPPDMPLEH